MTKWLYEAEEVHGPVGYPYSQVPPELFGICSECGGKVTRIEIPAAARLRGANLVGFCCVKCGCRLVSLSLNQASKEDIN